MSANESCVASFDWTELQNSFQEEGLPLFTLTQSFFPDINYLAFDPYAEVMENGETMFTIKMRGLPFDAKAEWMVNKCCALTWYERPYTPMFSKATVTATISATANVLVSKIDSYDNFNGLSIGDKVRIKKADGTISFRVVSNLTPDAIAPTTIVLDSAVTLAAGDTITKVGKTGVIGDCTNTYCSTSRYTYKSIKKNSYFTRIPVCIDFTICDLNLDRHRYHNESGDQISDYIQEIVWPVIADFNIQLANKIIFDRNIPKRTIAATDYGAETMGIFNEMQVLQDAGCGTFLHNFSACCASATCDEDILQELIRAVLTPIKNSGVYNNGEEVVVWASSKAMQAIWDMNEAIREKFGNGGLLYRDITNETERIVYNNRGWQYFTYMGLTYTFVHSQLLDAVFDNDSVFFFFPKSMFSIHQMPIAGVTQTGGKIEALYNKGMPTVELYSNADVNKATLGHSDCTQMIGNFTFASIWKHVGSGAYQFVTNFQSKAMCDATTCATALTMLTTDPATCDGLTGDVDLNDD